MFITGVLLTLWVTSISMLLIVGLERNVCHILGCALAAWQRWLIPLPFILLMGWNLDGVFSLQTWLETHPHGRAARYSENQAWDTDRFFVLGEICAGLVPFAMPRKLRQLVRIVPLFCLFYFIWVFAVFGILAIFTGVPMAN